MKYKKFTIKNYKAIREKIEIDLSKRSLLPIVGINECGKTSILKSILAFDYTNDDLNGSVKHLKDHTKNLYNYTDQALLQIEAEIEITKDEFKQICDGLKVKKNDDGDFILTNKQKKSLGDYWNVIDEKDKQNEFSNKITIFRRQKSKEDEDLIYDIDISQFDDKELNDKLCEEIILRLPHIIYLDDFANKIPDQIHIYKSETEANKAEYQKHWVETLETLFKKANQSYSIYSLKGMDEREREQVKNKVQTYLNEQLTNLWKKFQSIDETVPLNIDIQLKWVNYANKTDKSYLGTIEFLVKEDDATFKIEDRSKGFAWFFNFVMNVEFNPKIRGDGEKRVYLLDEPGSYLHAVAQAELCKKISYISESDNVIIATHSLYLLNPDYIPINAIHVASKEDKKIKLESIYKVCEGNSSKGKNSLKPVKDALKLSHVLDIDVEKHQVIIVEGINDYYAFRFMLNEYLEKNNIRLLPAGHASEIRTFISIMIGWECQWFALYDNDEEGRIASSKAINFFGEQESNYIKTLPFENKEKRFETEDLFAQSDIIKFKDFMGKRDVKFKKLLPDIWYSIKDDERQKLYSSISEETKNNFKKVIESISFRKINKQNS
jgi:predicted ATP-dependent endonuclease of OLD family